MKKIKKLQKKMQGQKVDGLVLQDVVSIFYLTGLRPSFGKILVSKKGAFFFVDSRYFEAYRKKSVLPLFLLKENSFEEFLKKHFQKPAKLAFDSISLSYKNFELLQEKLKKQKISKCQLIPWENPLKIIRSVKDREEVKKLKRAARINWAGFQHVKKILKTGITEKEVALEFELFIRKKGAEKLSFEPIVAFGENSSCPHHAVSEKKLQKNEIVLIDAGVTFEGYCSDMTRTLFFGKAAVRLKEMFQLVKQAKNAVFSVLKPGICIKTLEETAFSVIEKAGYADFYLHALGHGVGLQVHEFPVLSRKGPDKNVILEEGMVIAIEPGIYVPGLGGVRLEDTVLVTKKGFLNFY